MLQWKRVDFTQNWSDFTAVRFFITICRLVLMSVKCKEEWEIFCKMCLLHVDFYHWIFCELILFCMYLKDGTVKWKTKCISNRCAPPYPSIKVHREKRPKRIFLIGGAHHFVRIALYPSPCYPIASSLNSLFIRVCPMSIGLVVPELSSRHCTHVRLFFLNVERQI